jgi:hypothetical protein
MSAKDSTTSRLAGQRPGDFVLVWDAAEGRNVYHTLADAVERGGRMFFRTVGGKSYFGEESVVFYLHNSEVRGRKAA